MSEVLHKYVLFESSDLNKCIIDHVKQYQRIKYTCFDVSSKCIILGASSGGLHVFQRDPCSLLLILPYKEGSINHLAISPKEHWIGFATTRGVVCVVPYPEGITSVFENSIISREHEGYIISSLEWSSDGSKLFAGDTEGRVSVLHLSYVIGKSVLHSKCNLLMKLDTKIVQMSCQEEWLAVSTLTKCVLCHTGREEYKQVGIRPRFGVYGACVFRVEGNTDIDYRVFSARPGSRIWEVNSEGTVVKTHQLKDALTVPPTLVTKLVNSVANTNSVEAYSKQSVNFTKIYTFKNTFLFTFNTEAFYVFNSKHPEVILWNNEYKNIEDAKVLNNLIYLFTSDSKVYELCFMTVEELVVHSYNACDYVLCGKTCLFHLDLLIKMAEHSNKLNVLLGISEKLNSIGANKLLNDIMPLIEKITIFSKKILFQQLGNGIYSIENVHSGCSSTNVIKTNITPTQSSSYDSDLNCSAESTNIQMNEISYTVSSLNLNTVSPKFEKSDIFKSIYETLHISEHVSVLYGNSKISLLLEGLSIAQIITAFNELLDYSQEVGDTLENAPTLFSKLFLNFIEDRLYLLDDSLETINFVSEALICVEYDKAVTCTCGFPVPGRNIKPRFYKTCEYVIDFLFKNNEKNCHGFCSKIPYMWHRVIDLEDNSTKHIRLILQLGYIQAFNQIYKLFDEGEWRTATDSVVKLSRQKCVQCSDNFSNASFSIKAECDIIIEATKSEQVEVVSEVMKVSHFGQLMAQCIGGIKAVDILLDYSEHLQPGELSLEFYQYCLLNPHKITSE